MSNLYLPTLIYLYRPYVHDSVQSEVSLNEGNELGQNWAEWGLEGLQKGQPDVEEPGGQERWQEPAFPSQDRLVAARLRIGNAHSLG